MMISKEKALIGVTILAIVIAAASLAQVLYITAQLSEQTKRADSLSSRVDSLSSKLDSASSKADALSSKLNNQTQPGKLATGTRTIYLVTIPDVGGDGVDKFLPSTIVVTKGDKVRLVINNIDTGNDHGFEISAYGISKTIKSSDTVTIDFVADKAGVFEFHCTVDCGPGHSRMTGQFIVLGA